MHRKRMSDGQILTGINSDKQPAVDSNIIEDCHVSTDDMSYGNWVIEEGLVLVTEDMQKEQKEVPVVPQVMASINTNVHKISDPAQPKAGLAKPELPNPELPKPEPPKPEQPKAEPVNAEAPQELAALNQLIMQLNKYIGPRSAPDREEKINRLKNILDILDSNMDEKKQAKGNENSMENKQDDESTENKEVKPKPSQVEKDPESKLNVPDTENMKKKEDIDETKEVNTNNTDQNIKYVKKKAEQCKVVDPNVQPVKSEEELKIEREDIINNNNTEDKKEQKTSPKSKCEDKDTQNDKR